MERDFHYGFYGVETDVSTIVLPSNRVYFQMQGEEIVLLPQSHIPFRYEDFQLRSMLRAGIQPQQISTSVNSLNEKSEILNNLVLGLEDSLKVTDTLALSTDGTAIPTASSEASDN